MASPFSVFRKNRKLMLAVLTILAMFAFVFSPLFDKVGSHARQDTVAVTSKYGELHESDLQSLRNQHNRILGVLTRVIEAVGVPPAYARQYAEGMFGPSTDESVVETWLLAHYAEEMGMSVSNETINEFLKNNTQNRVRTADFQGMFKREGISDIFFFNAMRSQLLAKQVKALFRWSVAPTTPAERWEYFGRLKKQASIEAVGVPVARYADRIPDPSESDLKAFFDEHKNAYARPSSPTPGFHEPQRIAAQYVRADYEKLLASVTDEEIAADYEKNKADYDQYEKGAAGQKPVSQEQAAPAAGTGGVQTPDAAKPAEQPQSTQPPASETPKAAETPAATEQPKATEEKKDESKKEENKEEKPAGTSATQRRSPFMLTAYVDEKPAEAAPAAGATADKPAEAAPAAAAPANPPATETKPAAETPAATPSTTPAPAAQAPAAQAPAATESAPKAEEAPAQPAGPSPLIKAIIRRRIVDEKAHKAFQGIRDRVEQYRVACGKYEAAKNKGTKAVEPEKIDLEAMANSAGLTPGATGLISAFDAQRTELGTSLVDRKQPVWMFAFQSLSVYRAEISQDRANNYYLFWKTEETKERVPSFDDPGVREQVLAVWKMVKARDLATEEAKKLAEEARKAGKSLKEVFGDRPDLPVTTPEPFSWLTFGQVPLGSAPEAVRLSEVAGIDMPGREFMQTVFGLKASEIGVAKNAPETVAYVVQLSALTPSDDVLWMTFETDDFSKYQPAAQEDQQEMFTAWLNSIKKSANLKWTPGRDAAKAAAMSQPISESRGEDSLPY